jgi:spermidine synthase
VDVGPLARVYSWLERLVYRGDLQRARCAHLESLKKPQRVLIIGEGDGRFLQVFVERFWECERIDVVEPSGRMCEVARGRIGERAGVRFHECPLAVFDQGREYDLIVTHFFFDCFDAAGQRETVGTVRRLIAEKGVLLLADFQFPKNGMFARLRARFLLRTMYVFFGITSGLKTTSLIDPDSALLAAGFLLDDRNVSNRGFLRSDRWVVS